MFDIERFLDPDKSKIDSLPIHGNSITSTSIRPIQFYLIQRKFFQFNPAQFDSSHVKPSHGNTININLITNQVNSIPALYNIMHFQFKSIECQSVSIQFDTQHFLLTHFTLCHSDPTPSQFNVKASQCTQSHSIPIEFSSIPFKSTRRNSLSSQLDWIRFKWAPFQNYTIQLHSVYRNPFHVNRIWSHPIESGRIPSNTSQYVQSNSTQCDSTQPNSIQFD